MMHFIYGRSFANKEKEIVSQLAQLLDKEKGQIYYLVPDHLKFQSELNVLDSLHQLPAFASRQYMGMIQLQVLSFKRLAWYLLQDQPIFNRPHLSDPSLAMVIHHILIQNKDHLKVFKGEINQAGFIEKLVALFDECRQGRMKADDLLASAQQLGDSSFDQSRRAKFEELAFIFKQVEGRLKGDYIHQEDIMDALMAYVRQHDFSTTQVFINHFNQFTAKEEELILCLAKHCQDVTLALSLDDIQGVGRPQTQDVFYSSKKTFYRLFHMARQEGIDVRYQPPMAQDFDGVGPIFEKAEELLLDDPIERMKRPARPEPATDSVQLWQATSKQAEVFHLVSEIRQLVTIDKYKYKDILVLCRQMDDYHGIVQAYFDRNQLPLFIDHSKIMADHAFISFLKSVIDIDQYGWRQHDVINLLRTELLLPLDSDQLQALKNNRSQGIEAITQAFRRDLDLAENFFLAYGIDRQEFYQDQAYEWVEEGSPASQIAEQEAANKIRQFLRQSLLPLIQALKGAESFRQALKDIYTFMEDQAIADLLLGWRDWELAEGSLERAREYEEIWQAFIDLLDEIVEVMGDQVWEPSLFSQVIHTAFDQASYSNVPPAIDQVILTDFNRLPALKNKVVFILGLNQSCLPLQVSNQSLLTDEDRQYLEETTADDIYLHQDGRYLYYQENLLAYQLMTQATERLYLSYSSYDDDNKEVLPSDYFIRWQKHFGLPVNYKTLDTNYLIQEKGPDLLNYTPSSQEGVGVMLGIFMQAIKDNRRPHPFWLELFDYFSQQDGPLDFKSLMASLSYKNQPQAISPATAQALYGNNLYLSVSQIESFYQDPYSYFLSYGLKLKERRVQQLSPLERGVFLHAAMDLAIRHLQAFNLTLSQLQESDIHQLTQLAVDQVAGQKEFLLFNKTNRMAFQKNQLAAMVKQMINSLVFQSQQLHVTPYQSELHFGLKSKEGHLDPLIYELNPGKSIHVRGKIDRVDLLADDTGRQWFSVVDYKSSQHKIDYTDLYYGLSIQLLTYLKVIESSLISDQGQGAELAGAFYSHLKNPFITIDQALDSRQLDRFVQDQKKKEFILQGLIIDRPDFIAYLNQTIEEGEESGVFKLKRNKNGDYSAASRKNMVTLDQLHALYSYLDDLIRTAGQRILAGDISLAPFEGDDYVPSVKGPYRAISQFDAKLKENTYRPKIKRQLEDMLQKSKEADA